MRAKPKKISAQSVLTPAADVFTLGNALSLADLGFLGRKGRGHNPGLGRTHQNMRGLPQMRSHAMGDTYTVQSGDTLTAIAADYGISLSSLEALNPQISDPDLIQIGEAVNVPAAAGSPEVAVNLAAGSSDWIYYTLAAAAVIAGIIIMMKKHH